MYLLDTNILSDMVRNPFGRAAERADRVGNENFAISIVVAAEIQVGIAKNPSFRRAAEMRAILDTIDIKPLEQPCDEVYGRIRADLEKHGVVIGPNDLLVAAHALALDAVLVTDDEEFSRVPGLKTENWLRDAPATEQTGR